MPSHVGLRYNPQTDAIELTWQPPTDGPAGASYTYEVRKDDARVYSGTDLSFADAAPTTVATYTITAFNGGQAGISAVAVYDPVKPLTFYPYCFDVVHTQPTLEIKWECLLPLP
jgi:hypothetical protein